MRTRAANDNMVRTLVYFPCRMMIPGEKDYKSKMGKYIDQIEMWGPEMYGLPEGHPAFKAIARDIGRLRVMSA